MKDIEKAIDDLEVDIIDNKFPALTTKHLTHELLERIAAIDEMRVEYYGRIEQTESSKADLSYLQYMPNTLAVRPARTGQGWGTQYKGLFGFWYAVCHELGYGDREETIRNRFYWAYDEGRSYLIRHYPRKFPKVRDVNMLGVPPYNIQPAQARPEVSAQLAAIKKLDRELNREVLGGAGRDRILERIAQMDDLYKNLETHNEPYLKQAWAYAYCPKIVLEGLVIEFADNAFQATVKDNGSDRLIVTSSFYRTYSTARWHIFQERKIQKPRVVFGAPDAQQN